MSAVLAGHLARARELLAEPSPPGLFDLASRVGKLEAVLALICDAAESERQVRIPEARIRQQLTDSGAETAPGMLGQSRIIPTCPECLARARRDVRWTGALPSSGGDSWACGACGSTFATPPA